VKLAFILVLGTRWHFRVRKDSWVGALNCPDCQQPRPFIEKDAFKAFTLYWWPVFRTEDGGQVVECLHCGGRFVPPDELCRGTPGGGAAASNLPRLAQTSSEFS